MTFDPNLPFETVEAGAVPEFDPNLPFSLGNAGNAVPEEDPGFDVDRRPSISRTVREAEVGERGELVNPEIEPPTTQPSLFSVSENLTERQKIRIAAAMVATPNEKAIADVVKSVVPGVEISEDEPGNVIIQFPQGAGGQRVFVNPPGFDRTDLTSLAAELVKFFPAGRAAAGAQTIIGGAVKSFSAEGATSVLGDVIAGQLGSEQGIDIGRAGASGGGAALADLLTPRVIRFFRRVANTKKFYDKKTGVLTAEGQRAAEAAGIDPSIIDASLGKDFAENLAQGASPDIAIGTALGNKFNVGLTKGQASQDIDVFAEEEILRNVQPTSPLMRDPDAAQATAARTAAIDVQEKVGGIGVGREVDAAEVASREITQQRNALVDSIDTEFEFARGKNAAFTGKSVTELSKAAAVVSREFPIDNVLTPASFKILKQMARLSKRVKSAKKRGANIQFAFFEQTRRRINNSINTIPLSNPADKALAVRLKEQYDGFLDDAFDNALFAGDLDVLDSFKKARRLRFELAERFGKRNANDEAGRVVDKIIKTDATPQQIVNHIFGSARLGGKAVSEKVVNRLKESLGEKSQGFIALQELGFMRLTRPAGKEFSPELAAKNIELIQQQAPGMMKALYNEEQQNLIRQFGNLMKRLPTPPEAKNVSRTAFVLRNAARKAVGRATTILTFRKQPEKAFLLQIFSNIVLPKRARALSGARRAFSPFRTPGSPAVITGGATAGSAGAEQLEE